MTRAWYTTRERVMRVSDVKAAAYLASEIDAAIESASQAVDDLCKRGDAIRPGFAPWTGTIEFDWPVLNNDNAYRLWLNNHALLTAESATSAGADVSADLLPWPEYGPPYSALDLNQGSSSIFTFNSGRGQRSISVTGVWGYSDAEKTSTTWTLGGTVGGSDTTLLLNAPIGVGSIVRVNDERVQVIERFWADSGQTASLASSMAAQTFAVSDGSVFLAGEELALDSERVLVRDVIGNNLTVQRAVSGSVLAAHTTAAIYWARSCQVERAALGTTAAAHTSGAMLRIFTPPALVEQLTIAYVLERRNLETGGYADERKFSGSTPLDDLEKRVLSAYGRQLRHRAV
jgi:hypothetical protein